MNALSVSDLGREISRIKKAKEQKEEKGKSLESDHFVIAHFVSDLCESEVLRY